MDKAILLGRVTAALQSTGGSVLASPGVYEGSTGDIGDQAARAEEKWRADALNRFGGSYTAQLQTLKGVDPAPTAVVRVGALVHVEAPGVPKQRQTFFILPSLCAPSRLTGVDGIIFISDMSPVGAALMYRMPGEVVRVATPKGTRTMKIIGVE